MTTQDTPTPPSDAEIHKLWIEHKQKSGAMGFARALLARYGAQPSLAAAIHYPDCWDTAAYSTLADALAAVYEHFRCSECQPVAATEPSDDMPSLDERAAYSAEHVRQLIRRDRKLRAPVAAQEPVGLRAVAEQMQKALCEELAAYDPPIAHVKAAVEAYSKWRSDNPQPPTSAQPCDHVYEARPIDGSTRANVPCEAVCRKCGYRPTSAQTAASSESVGILECGLRGATFWPDDSAILKLRIGEHPLYAAPVAAQPSSGDNAWRELFWEVAKILKCLPSTFVDANEHVLRAARNAMATQPSVPDQIAEHKWDDPDSDYTTGQKEGYAQGWNDCRAVMLASAPTPPADRQAQQDGGIPVASVDPQITLTLRQSMKLVEFFGGHDTEVTIGALPVDPPGLYAWCTDYPDEGAQYLGPTVVDDDLAMHGIQQDADKVDAAAGIEASRVRILKAAEHWGLQRHKGPTQGAVAWQSLIRRIGTELRQQGGQP